MKYLCLVYVAESAFDALSPQELDTVQAESLATDQELEREGHLLLAEALQPISTATTVRVRDGRLSATDGPFAETKEQLAGFVYVEAADLNQAIQIAGRIPLARLGCVEVRPVMDIEPPVGEPADR